MQFLLTEFSFLVCFYVSLEFIYEANLQLVHLFIIYNKKAWLSLTFMD